MPTRTQQRGLFLFLTILAIYTTVRVWTG